MMKHISAIVMVMMLLAQIGIAQHATVHFTDHGHYEHHHDDHAHDDHQDNERSAAENCEICVITKSLAFALINDEQNISIHYAYSHDHLNTHDPIISKSQRTLYNPRAPPTFLI